MPVMPKRSFAEQARQKPLFFWIVLLIAVVLLGLYVFDAVIIARYGTLTRDNGWTAVQRDGKWVVDEVNPQGPAGRKVQRGDVLLAITDDHPRIPKDGKITSRQYVYAMEVLRGVEHRRLELQSEIRRTDGRLPSMLGDLATSLGFCLVGL